MARRRGEVAAAGHTGNVETIRTALADEAPAVRATALGALSRLGLLGVSELRTGLDDPDVNVRRRAAELAWRAARPTAAPANDSTAGPADDSTAGTAAPRNESSAPPPPPEIVALLLDHLPTPGASEDASVVEAACFSLGELRPPGVTAALATVATDHPDPLCRESAVAALGAIGEEDALPVILVALGDKPAVRRRAVLALASFEGPEVEAALEQAMSDRDWQVRQAAEDLSGSRPRPT